MADATGDTDHDLEMVYWRAIMGWALERFEQTGRKAVHALQRIKASGIFGDDYNHKTLWDEYCHEVQEGPTLAEDAMMGTIRAVVVELVRKLPEKEAALLSVSDSRLRGAEAAVNEMYLAQQVTEVLSETAGQRNLSRFDPRSDHTF